MKCIRLLGRVCLVGLISDFVFGLNISICG